MLSRVADALYWMARYSERTQTNAHILQVQLLNMLEQSGQEHDYIDHWEAVLNICASKEEYLANYTTIRVNPLIDYLLFLRKMAMPFMPHCVLFGKMHELHVIVCQRNFGKFKIPFI